MSPCPCPLVANSTKIFRLPSLQKPVYVAEGLSFLPPFLSAEFTVRRTAARERLSELAVAELGDAVYKAPYLIVHLLCFVFFCRVDANESSYEPLSTIWSSTSHINLPSRVAETPLYAF